MASVYSSIPSWLSPVDGFVVAYLLNRAKSTSSGCVITHQIKCFSCLLDSVDDSKKSKESCLCNVEFSCALHFFGRQDRKRGIEIECALSIIVDLAHGKNENT